MNPNEVIKEPFFKVYSDGASLVAHDIAAQLHVIGFCLEELSRSSNFASEKFILQVKEAFNIINHEISDFRSFLKDLNPTNQDMDFSLLFERVDHILHLFQGKLIKKMDYSWGSIPQGTVSADRVIEITYAIYSFILDGLHELKNQSIKMDATFDENILTITINEHWKSHWWEIQKEVKTENPVLKGMQSKIYGEEMFRNSKAYITVGDEGIMGRIPISLNIKI